MRTVLLDIVTWDLVVDAGGNIAVATDPYQLAQDAASEIKLYQGEAYWDTSRGIPYTDQASGAPAQILGLSPPFAYMKKLFNDAALLVPGVVAAQTFVQSFVDRKFTGQVQVTDKDGVISVAGF